ncbi:hypothetical protein HMPREF0908_0948 [Selenomonas flueggei ATCC 43531]|uniref:Uncharacterized protein n=1 Tax=Selenomonas flueggei ATCC 43531 TaxID=638302 RepID=C4V354_9FIRM|nr:hypothetical protein HMPREF0908_0948 [Selenomonas flueggei ATCC 43531]
MRRIDPHLCGVVSAVIFCTSALHAARQGYFAVSSLIRRKGLPLFCECPRRKTAPLLTDLGRMLCKSTASMGVAGNAFSKKGTAAKNSYF